MATAYMKRHMPNKQVLPLLPPLHKRLRPSRRAGKEGAAAAKKCWRHSSGRAGGSCSMVAARRGARGHAERGAVGESGRGCAAARSVGRGRGRQRRQSCGGTPVKNVLIRDRMSTLFLIQREQTGGSKEEEDLSFFRRFSPPVTQAPMSRYRRAATNAVRSRYDENDRTLRC